MSDWRTLLRDRASRNGASRTPHEAPAPKPVDVDTEYRSFPLAALPEPVRGYVDACAAAVGCDPAYVALPLLSTLAAAVGNTRRILLKRGWAEPAILWTAIIGESGTAKSPAIDHAREYPRRRQSQARKRHDMAMQAYLAEAERHKAAMAEWRREPEGDPPQEPERPTLERALVDDTTVEALGPILVENWRGVLILRDELAGWLGGFDRYARSPRGGGEAAKWIEMHGGRPIVIDRRHGEPRTLYVPRAAVSIGGGIQPGIIRRLMTQEHRDSGLLARLLMAWPPRRPRQWTEAEPDESLTRAVQAVYDRLWELTPTSDAEGDPTPIIVGLTGQAKRDYADFVDEHGAEQYHLDGDLAAAWSKLEGYAARLGLIHHLARWAAGDRRDPEAGIDAESMRAGITLARWFGREDRRIYAMLAESTTDAERRELLELIRRRGGSITPRELMQTSRSYPTADAAEAALAGLVEARLATWVTMTPARGPQTRAVRLL